MSISTAEEFSTRREEILAAINLAAPVLKEDRTTELKSKTKEKFLKRTGSPVTPTRMAYYLETAMKETLTLTEPPAKSRDHTALFKNIAPLMKESAYQTATPRETISYRELRDALSPILTIPTLGRRTEIEIHNPSYGPLTVINSQGKNYQISETDWNSTCSIRSQNPQNPWGSKHYTGTHYSYGLIHAAALLREIEENGLVESDDLVGTSQPCRDTW